MARIAPRLLMSHLACAETPEHPMNRAQLTLFRELRAEFPDLPASLANSAGIHLGADFHFDLVRPGIALYGAAFAKDRPPLATVVTAKARILQVREASAGDAVGYGATKHLEDETRIAVLSAGYADGYLRLAGSSDDRPGAFASVRGRPAPLLGRVSMDLIAIDVTGIAGVTEGDWVELFGTVVPIDTVATAAETIGYELLTGLSRRAERVYLNRPRVT
jgi:alanine racemase